MPAPTCLSSYPSSPASAPCEADIEITGSELDLSSQRLCHPRPRRGFRAPHQRLLFQCRRPAARRNRATVAPMWVWGVRVSPWFVEFEGVISMSLHIRAAVLAACLVCLFAVPAQPARANEALPAASQQAVPTIEVRDLQTLIKEKAFFFLLDVRQPEEFNQGHIEGAVLMPLSSLPDSYKRIPKGVKLVVYCRSGHRSAQAVSFLRDRGYVKAVSLSGGYMAWSGAP